MNNLSANYERILEVLRKISNENLLSYQRRVPKMKDLELISLALTAEYMGIDSENHLFRPERVRLDDGAAASARQKRNKRPYRPAGYGELLGGGRDSAAFRGRGRTLGDGEGLRDGGARNSPLPLPRSRMGRGGAAAKREFFYGQRKTDGMVGFRRPQRRHPGRSGADREGNLR